MNNDSLRLQKNASKTTLLLSGKLPYKSSLVSNHCSQRTISMPPGLHLLLGWVGFLSEQAWTDNTCRSRTGGWPVAAASYTVSAPRDPETHFTHDKGLNPSTCRCTGGGVRSPTWLFLCLGDVRMTEALVFISLCPANIRQQVQWFISHRSEKMQISMQIRCSQHRSAVSALLTNVLLAFLFSH